MRGVLNEITQTVHKHETGGSEYHTSCGATTHLSPDNLQVVSIGASAGPNTQKCGRCFRGEGGY